MPKTVFIMKLTLILLTAALLATASNGISQTITVTAKNSSVEEVIAFVEKQAKLVFIYKKEILKDAPRITLTVKDMPVEKFLTQAFKDQAFTWSIRNQTVVLKKNEENFSENVTNN